MPVSAIFAEYFAPNWPLLYCLAIALVLAVCAVVSIRLVAKPGPVVVLLQWLFTAVLVHVWVNPAPDDVAWSIPAILSAFATLANTFHRPSYEEPARVPTYGSSTTTTRRPRTRSTAAAVTGIPRIERL